MPRIRGASINLLEDLQGGYDAKQRQSIQSANLDIREQKAGIDAERVQQAQEALQNRAEAEGFTEQHQQQLVDIQDKASTARESEISARLAQEQVTLDRKNMMHEQEIGAWKAIGRLDPKAEDFNSKMSEVGATFPAAFASVSGEGESALGKHLSDLQHEHDTWDIHNQKLQEEQQTGLVQQRQISAFDKELSGYGLKRTDLDVADKWGTNADGSRFLAVTDDKQHLTADQLNTSGEKTTAKDGTAIKDYITIPADQFTGLVNQHKALGAAPMSTPSDSALPPPHIDYVSGGRYGNMRFKGGDANDQSNWEPAQ